MSAIPSAARLVTAGRYGRRCARCRGPGAETHHRRSRSVRDEHTHCPCNLVLLCSPCHRWAHSNPVEARANGFIVSRYEEPVTIPVHTPWGIRHHDCRGVAL